MTPAEPPVWIIILNWNGRDMTLQCLDSLRAVTYPGRHILVVDNGSTDGSVGAFRDRHPDITVLPLPENRRFAGGNNAGMRHALAHGADLLLLLNNDTTVDPGFLLPMVKRIASDSSAGIIAPKILYHAEPDLLWYAGGAISFWTGTMKHTGIREHDRGQHDIPGKTGYATGCCLLVRKELVERIGMLDESYTMYTEDADWCMRARQAGYSILYEPRARIWHKVSVSAGGHLSWYKLRNKALGNLRFYARYARWYHWLTLPWMTVLSNGLAALRYVLHRRSYPA
jgi:GT2 family glycosyltransferase